MGEMSGDSAGPLIGRVLIVAGLLLAAAGCWLVFGPSVPRLGRLPGDLRVERPGFSLYVPITTCILLSAAASLVLYLIQRLR